MSYELHYGDCLRVLRTLPPCSVDMVLCDLPYGTTRNKWDSPIALPALWDCWRAVCKPNAAIVLHAQAPFTASLILSNPRWFRHEWIWVKGMATGHLNVSHAPLKAHESICVFYHEKPPYHPQMTAGAPYVDKRPRGRAPSTNYGGHAEPTLIVNTGERYPRSVLYFPDDRPKMHPTQKPLDLAAYLIRTYSNPGALVLDNAMGSGTTGIAALENQRRFIGIEQDGAYFTVAERWLASLHHTTPASAPLAIEDCEMPSSRARHAADGSR